MRYSGLTWATAFTTSLCASLFVIALSLPAAAIPSFVEQTGQPCAACHIGGFGPQLTPLGRSFKLSGYTMRASTAFSNPLSAMAIASFLKTAKDQSGSPAPNYSTNNNVALDQVSLFAAGGIGEHFGGFAQFTYDGIGRGVAWDNLDLRATTQTKLLGSDVLIGLGLNNAPGIQDAWNTLPAWGFPYTSSSLAPSPASGPILAGGLSQGVLGVSAFAYWDNSIYTEVAFYWTPSSGFLKTVGGNPGAGEIAGVAPYLRVAYEKDYDAQNFEIGAFGFFPDLYPGGDRSSGTSDLYSDVGVDGSYQFMGDTANIYTLNARYTYERQHLAASQLLLGAANTRNSLNDVRLDGSYYWKNIIGGTIGAFDTWGSTDQLLYSANSTFRPNSTGLIFQIDGTVFGRDMSELGGRLNVRAGVQYTAYTKFDGGGANYDGLGRNASDNNTLRIFTWVAL
jgi:hypothetical protein